MRLVPDRAIGTYHRGAWHYFWNLIISFVYSQTWSTRVRRSGLGLFAGLGLGVEQKGFGLGLEDLELDLNLGIFVNLVHFQFSLCTFYFAVLCLGHMTFFQPVSYTQPKISVHLCSLTIMNEKAMAYSHLHCIDFFATLKYNLQLDLDLDLKLVDLELTWTWLLLDLIQVCLFVLSIFPQHGLCHKYTLAHVLTVASHGDWIGFRGTPAGI